MKRILPLLLILLLILTGCSAKNADSPAADAPTDTPLTGTSYVQIDVKDYGTIVAELYADTAPITVANFLSLVDSGFSDGLTFIMHADAPHLDGQYAAFGKVISGMEVVDAICEHTPVTDRNGTVAKANQPVIERIIRVEKPEE